MRVNSQLTCLKTSCTMLTLSLVAYITRRTSSYSLRECSSTAISLESFESRPVPQLIVLDMVLALLPGWTAGSPSDTTCTPISTSPVDGSDITRNSSLAVWWPFTALQDNKTTNAFNGLKSTLTHVTWTWTNPRESSKTLPLSPLSHRQQQDDPFTPLTKAQTRTEAKVCQMPLPTPLMTDVTVTENQTKLNWVRDVRDFSPGPGWGQNLAKSSNPAKSSPGQFLDGFDSAAAQTGYLKLTVMKAVLVFLRKRHQIKQLCVITWGLQQHMWVEAVQCCWRCHKRALQPSSVRKCWSFWSTTGVSQSVEFYSSNSPFTLHYSEADSFYCWVLTEWIMIPNSQWTLSLLTEYLLVILVSSTPSDSDRLMAITTNALFFVDCYQHQVTITTSSHCYPICT